MNLNTDTKVNQECNSSKQNKPIVYWDGKHFASKDKSSLADIPLYDHQANLDDFEAGRKLGIQQEKAMKVLVDIGQEIENTNKPVAWYWEKEQMVELKRGNKKLDKYFGTPIPLYTHPVKELTLTPDEIFDVWDEHTDYDGNFVTSIDDFVKAILRKAQEK